VTGHIPHWVASSPGAHGGGENGRLHGGSKIAACEPSRAGSPGSDRSNLWIPLGPERQRGITDLDDLPVQPEARGGPEPASHRASGLRDGLPQSRMQRP
jgi:hypothetical protein